jgi:hypothetical protein
MKSKTWIHSLILLSTLLVTLSGCMYCWVDEAKRTDIDVSNGGQGYDAVIQYLLNNIVPGITRDDVHKLLDKLSEVSITKGGSRRENISIEPDHCYPIKFSVFYDDNDLVINKQWENVN